MYVHENHHNSNDFQKVHKLITCTLQCKINVYVSTGVVKIVQMFMKSIK